MALSEPWPGMAPEDYELAVPPLDAYVEDVAADLDDGSDVEGRTWADRKLARLRRLRHEVEQADAVATQRIDDIRAWHDRVTERIYRRIDEITGELDAFMRHEAEAAGVKTLTLPNGDLVLRGGPESRNYRRVIVVGDEDAVARELPPDFVRVRHSVDKSQVRQATVPGPAVADVPGETVPDGYEARVAVAPESGLVLDGVYVLVPTRPTFIARPRPWGAS